MHFIGVMAIALTLLSTPTVYGQRTIDKRTGWALKDRIYFGGGITLGGGDNSGGISFFQIGLSPTVGYMITPSLSAGIRINWIYTSFISIQRSINQYGGGVFAQYNIVNNIIKGLFAYGEYGFINTPTSLNDQNRVAFSQLPLGLGYRFPLGDRGAINAMALYDVLFLGNSNRITNSPWIFRVNFTY